MRAAVVGGGVIGLAAAWRLARDGLDVTLFEPDPSRSASRVAAGMLAPLTEAHPTEPTLLAAGLEALALWPDFAASLPGSGYSPHGTLVTGYDADDLAALAEFAARLAGLGIRAEPLTGSAARELEPALAPGVRGGLSVPGDHSVDNRALLRSLWAACDGAGVTVVADGVDSLAGLADRTDVVVVAAGAWVGRLLPEFVDVVRPVRGETLRLVGGRYAPRLTRTVRALVEGQSVYLVPRASGELVVGATQVEAGFDRTVTAGAVHRLLADARRVLPALDEYALVEATAGLRPVSRDGVPIVGRVAPNLVVAAGHGRNGVLFAPLTAELVRRSVHGEPPHSGLGPARLLPEVAR